MPHIVFSTYGQIQVDVEVIHECLVFHQLIQLFSIGFGTGDIQPSDGESVGSGGQTEI